MILGNIMAGGHYANGEIKNIGYNASNDINIYWHHKDKPEIIYYDNIVDGDLKSRSIDQSFDFLPLNDPCSYDVIIARDYDTKLLDYHGDLKSNRPYLSWHPSSSADTIGYNVYYNNNLIKEIRDIVAFGDLVSGVYDGIVRNQSYSITIGSNNKFTTTYSGGSINIRDKVPLGDNIFLDFASWTYKTGDIFNFHIGPRCNFLGPELANGYHIFEIKSVDRAGNLSTGISKTIFISQRPKAPRNIIAKWTGTEIELSWDQPADPSITGYNIYSNYSHVFGSLSDYCDVLLIDKTSTSRSHVFAPDILGDWMFYIQSINANGESDSIELVKLNTGVPTDTLIINPIVIELSLLPAGAFRAEFNYDHSEGPDCSEFLIFYSNSQMDIFTNLETNNYQDIVVIDKVEDGYRTYIYDIGASMSSVRFFAVRSSDGTIHSNNYDFYSINVDFSSPNPPSNIIGVPQ
jgi:hypothetical protein